MWDQLGSRIWWKVKLCRLNYGSIDKNIRRSTAQFRRRSGGRRPTQTRKSSRWHLVDPPLICQSPASKSNKRSFQLHFRHRILLVTKSHAHRSIIAYSPTPHHCSNCVLRFENIFFGRCAKSPHIICSVHIVCQLFCLSPYETINNCCYVLHFQCRYGFVLYCLQFFFVRLFFFFFCIISFYFF